VDNPVDNVDNQAQVLMQRIHAEYTHRHAVGHGKPWDFVLLVV